MYYLTKTFTFDSAHKLVGYDGLCANMHGHTYKIEIIIKGTELNKLGLLLDFNELKDICKKHIIEVCDHKILNEVKLFRDQNPTAEFMAKIFFDILKEQLKGNAVIHAVGVWETPTSQATYQED